MKKIRFSGAYLGAVFIFLCVGLQACNQSGNETVSDVVNSMLPGTGFVAIPGQKGGQDIFGAYEIDADWPKDLSTIPGHEDWTFGQARAFLLRARIVFLYCNAANYRISGGLRDGCCRNLGLVSLSP